MGIKLAIFILMLALLPLASADTDTETYLPNASIDFIHTITSSGEPVDNIEANITITDPDNVVLIGFEPMSFNSVNKTFNFTLGSSFIAKLGTYKRCIVATNTTDWSDPACFSFDITNTGKKLDTSEAIIYIIILIVLIGIFSLSSYGAVVIPAKHKRNEFDEIIELNWKKYSKIGLFGLSYLLLVWILYISWNLSFGFLSLGSMATAFHYLYRIVFALTLPVFVISIIIMIINFTKDKKIQKMLDTGVSGVI